jgi:hypothetical protein
VAAVRGGEEIYLYQGFVDVLARYVRVKVVNGNSTQA